MGEVTSLEGKGREGRFVLTAVASRYIGSFLVQSVSIFTIPTSKPRTAPTQAQAHTRLPPLPKKLLSLEGLHTGRVAREQVLCRDFWTECNIPSLLQFPAPNLHCLADTNRTRQVQCQYHSVAVVAMVDQGHKSMPSVDSGVRCSGRKLR